MKPLLRDRIRGVYRHLRCWALGHPDGPEHRRACAYCGGWIK